MVREKIVDCLTVPLADVLPQLPKLDQKTGSKIFEHQFSIISPHERRPTLWVPALLLIPERTVT